MNGNWYFVFITKYFYIPLLICYNQVVESSPFVDLITTLAPEKNVISRRTLTRRIEERYDLLQI